MKRFLTPLLFTLTCLLSISANSGAPSYFIPNEPTIVSPDNSTSNVDITPEFISSKFEFSENYEQANNPTLNEVRWLTYQADESIELLGGRKLSSSHFHESNFEYEIPFLINISGQTATKLRVDTQQDIRIIELLNTKNEKIASALLELNKYDFKPSMNFIVINKYSDLLLLQWNLVNKEGIELTAEFLLLDGKENNKDLFGWRTMPNLYTNPLFDSNYSAAGCRVSVDNTNTSHNGYDNDFDIWKGLLSINYDKFYLACTSKQTEIAGKYAAELKELNIIDVVNFLPEISIYSSPTEKITLNDSQALKLATKYITQIQHIAISGDKTGASNWSKPISFTTRSANTNYQVTVPTDLTFIAEQAKDLSFKIANTGSEEGSPKVIIRLSFEALKAVNGNVNDFFNVSVGGQSCTMAQKNGKTNFTCQLNALKANGTADLKAKITVKDTAIKSIEYKVCDAEKCDATDFIAVNITVKTASAAPAETKSSSSSSGGSMFWLFLMAPLLLVRRK